MKCAWFGVGEGVLAGVEDAARGGVWGDQWLLGGDGWVNGENRKARLRLGCLHSMATQLLVCSSFVDLSVRSG